MTTQTGIVTYCCLDNRHLGIFDLIKSEDEKELASRYDAVSNFD